MSIQDPTLQAIASYYMSPAEAFIGLMVLFLNLFLEIVEKGIPKDNSPIGCVILPKVLWYIDDPPGPNILITNSSPSEKKIKIFSLGELFVVKMLGPGGGINES